MTVKLNSFLKYIPSSEMTFKPLDQAKSLFQNVSQYFFAKPTSSVPTLENRLVPFNFLSLSAHFEKLLSILMSVNNCSKFQSVATYLFSNAISSKILDKVTIDAFHHCLEIPRKEILVYSRLEKALQEPSCLFHLDRKELDHGCIGYHNGINTSLEWAKTNATQLSDQCCQEHNIHCTYSATVGLSWDLFSAVLSQGTIATPGVIQLLKNWQDFFERDPSRSFLQICHSRGAIEVNNALTYLPKEKQQRILVIAIAPACFIPSSRAKKIVNFIIHSDPVPKVALNRHLSNSENTVMLGEHKDGQFSHYLLGSSYLNILAPLVDQYIQTNDIATTYPAAVQAQQKLHPFSFANIAKKITSMLPQNSHAKKADELEDQLKFLRKMLEEKTSESFCAMVLKQRNCLFKKKQKLLQRQRELCGGYSKDPTGLLCKVWRKYKNAEKSKALAHLKHYNGLKKESKTINAELYTLNKQVSNSPTSNRCIEELTTASIKKQISSLERLRVEAANLAEVGWKKTAKTVANLVLLAGGYIIASAYSV